MILTPKDVEHRELHNILLSGVAPRPIALVASQDSEGNVNLSPFSFFNCYASKPPIIAIGPAFSAKTGKAKDTYLNILETKIATISAVTYSMVEAISLASCEYPKGVDEFVKSGLTKKESQTIPIPGVAESPFIMECTLLENIPLGREIGGNGNLMLLEAHSFTIDDNMIVDGKLHPHKMDLVARMGYNWYARCDEHSVFELHKPQWNGIGVDALPSSIRQSSILTGNNLAKLAGVKEIPEKDSNFSILFSSIEEQHLLAQQFLANGDLHSAWQTLLLS
ncbi:MAG: flavin reductase family protein [Candidatus Kapabacteria bacterium]|jgi:flavin reductase (DIM6/NTAB) family NADH-FMN oxidoreductase RutF|nr:flavin reductase family protein [Candidatus Kapabacteria bacterium]